MGRAKQYVDQSMSDAKNAINSLQQAMTSVEKQDNKTKIQEAMSSLNSACDQLSQYRD
ncbi:hypothetical protein [Clostridium oceanicum]|uniref:DUF1657 domain-containing protein n=1 Tax=Clostridium oceanicum TaxID=1543 RepID=A0ABN1J902_9CLOT